MANNEIPDGTLSRGFTEVQFRDQYGELRTIHRQKGNSLRVKKRADSVSHLLNRAAGVLTGKKIRAARIAAGLTLAALHDKAGLSAAPGLSKNRMYEIERAGVGRNQNKQGVRFGTLYALAMALDCEVYDLLPSAAEVAKEAGVDFVATVAARLAKVA